MTAAAQYTPQQLEAIARMARARIAEIRNTPEYCAEVRERILSGFHPKQRGVWDSIVAGARYIAMCCSRRAGKTHIMASIIILLLLEAKFGQEVVFVAPTLKRGKELIWQEVCKLVDEYFLGWQLVANQGTIRTPSGAYFRIVGLDNKRQIGKISRGGNAIAFLTDETQEYAHLLSGLLVGAGPALSQSRGVFIAAGTPGPVKRGYWHAICHGGDGFRSVHWTMRDNPYLGRDANEIIAEEMERNGWHANHPTLLREYYGLWVDDSTMLVCELSESLNIVDAIPEYDPKTWRHFIGVDYGFDPDPSAWVVAAAHPHKNLVAIIHAEKHGKLTSEEICDKTNVLHVDFRSKRIVGDSASGGATFINDWNKRYGRKHKLRMLHAEKHDKRGSIKTLNTELRTGRLLLLRSGASMLINEMLELQWADPEHTDLLPGDDHCFDAARYVLRAITAYLAKPEEAPPSDDEQELQRIIERNQRAEMANAGGWE